MDELVNIIGHRFGITPATMSFYLTLTIMICNRISRMIPDSATGFLGAVRIVTKIIGMHVKDNSGVTAISDGLGGVVRRAEADKIPEAVQTVEEVKDEVIEPVKDVFKKARGKRTVKKDESNDG